MVVLFERPTQDLKPTIGRFLANRKALPESDPIVFVSRLKACDAAIACESLTADFANNAQLLSALGLR